MRDLPHLSLMKGMLQPRAGQDMAQVTLACLSDYFCSWRSLEHAEACPLLHPAGVCTALDACKSHWSMLQVVLGSFLEGHQGQLLCPLTVTGTCCQGRQHNSQQGGRVLIIVKGQH